MIIPMQIGIEEEPVNSPRDVVVTLDKWVLPHYPHHITNNPGLTRAQCMGVLQSLQYVGKMGFQLKASEVQASVNAFLEDRLWVDLAKLPAPLPGDDPKNWLLKPTMSNSLHTLKQVLLSTYPMIKGLVAAWFQYNLSKFKKDRKVELPELPYEKRLTAKV